MRTKQQVLASPLKDELIAEGTKVSVAINNMTTNTTGNALNQSKDKKKKPTK